MTNRLPVWSVRAYRLLLQAYPASVRRDYGDAMTQVFADLVRDAWRDSGRAGLRRVWRQTLPDLAISLGRAYASEPRGASFRAAVAAGLIFVCAMALANAYGAVRFRGFYDPPAFTRVAAPSAGEDALLAAYDEALAGELGRYRTFALATGLVLAVLLGVTAAAVSVWQASLLHGAAALVAGAAATIVALSLLPPIWFPFDRYPPAALWVMGGGLPLSVFAWLAVAAVARLGRGSARPTLA